MHCIYQRVLVTRCIHVLSGTYAYIYSYTILSAIQSKGGSLENPDCFANSDEFFSGTWECDELRLALVSGCYLSCFRMLFVHFQVSLDTEPPPPIQVPRSGGLVTMDPQHLGNVASSWVQTAKTTSVPSHVVFFGNVQISRSLHACVNMSGIRLKDFVPGFQKEIDADHPRKGNKQA